MHIRPIDSRDLSTVIDISVDANIDDELFIFLGPNRRQYPDSWRKFATIRNRTRIVTAGCWGYVAIPSAHPDDHDKIMGFAWWQRAAAPGAAANDPWSNNNTSWYTALNRALLRAEDRFDMLMRGNPAVDYAALKCFMSPEGENATMLSPLEKGVTHWHLAVLAVHPSYHRRGVGSGLVNFGLEVARKESRETGVSVPVSLVASPMGFSLYRRMGFRAVGWMELPTGVPHEGGAAMVWDESDTWIETEQEGTSLKGRPVQAKWSQRALDNIKST